MSPERRELQQEIENLRRRRDWGAAVSWAFSARNGSTRYVFRPSPIYPISDRFDSGIIRRVRAAGGMIAKDRR